jgi:hypothetical protein
MKHITLRFFTLSFICILVLSCYKKSDKVEKQTYTKKLKDTSQSKVKNIVREEDTISIEYLNKYYSYDYETKLSNGYNLEFKYFKKNRNSYIEMCLNLRKDDVIIDTLNIMGYGAPHKNLGYIGADFNKYFAFVNSFGSGNPHEFKLIRKSNGEVIKSGFIVDNFKNPELLLYAKGYDSLMLYDIEKDRDHYIENISKSKEIDCMVSELNQFLKIKKASKDYVMVEIENSGNKKITKKYSR